MLKQFISPPLHGQIAIIFTAVALAAVVRVPSASAADLVLECAVMAEGADRKQRQLTKRIDVTMEPRYFERYRDDGNRFRLEKDGFPVFISRAMILFQEETSVKETYDRNTGDYLYENFVTGRQVAGHCDKLIDRTKKSESSPRG